MSTSESLHSNVVAVSAIHVLNVARLIGCCPSSFPQNEINSLVRCRYYILWNATYPRGGAAYDLNIGNEFNSFAGRGM